MPSLTSLQMIRAALLLVLLASTMSAGPSGGGCEAQSTPEQQCATVDEVRVQLRWLKTGQFAGYYAAEDQGFYLQVRRKWPCAGGRAAAASAHVPTHTYGYRSIVRV